MAQKIKKRFFKLLPYSTVFLLVIGVGICFLNLSPNVQPVKAAALDGISSNIRLLDTNSNGKIDQVQFLVSNPNFPAETVTLYSAMPHGLSVWQAGNSINILNVTTAPTPGFMTVTVILDETDINLLEDTDGVNSATPIELAYNSGLPPGLCIFNVAPCIGDTLDEELNLIAGGDSGPTDTEIDNAVPVLLYPFYVDGTHDGQIDGLILMFSENITLSQYEDNDWTIPVAGDINLQDESFGFGGGNAVIMTITADANETGCPTTQPQITYNAANGVAFSLKDQAVAPNLVSNFTLPLLDGVSPVILSGNYQDTDSNGAINRVLLKTTIDESLSCNAYTGAELNFSTPGTVNLTASLGDGCSTNGTDAVMIDLLTEGNPDTTGGPVDPVVSYFDGTASAILDAAGYSLVDNGGSYTLTDAAAPLISSVVYQDNNGDGSVETIRTIWTEPVEMSGADTTDWAIVGGDINATFSSAPDDSDGDNFLDVLVTADANETGTSVFPSNLTITYNSGSNDPVFDESLAVINAPTNGPLTAFDQSAPILVTAVYQDTTSDGQVDNIAVTFSENIYLYGTIATDFTISGGAVGLAAPSAVAVRGGNGNSAILDISTVGTPGITGGVGDPTLTYTGLVGMRLGDFSEPTAPFGPVAVTDGAAPQLKYAEYLDLDSNGTIETFRTIWTEDVVAAVGEGADWGISGGTFNPVFSSAPADAGGDDQYDLAITAVGNLTGSTTVVSIGYTDSGDGDISDSLGNITSSSAPLPVTDWAAPQLKYAEYLDLDSNGTIETFRTIWTENVVAAVGESADWGISGGTFNPVFSSAPADAGGDDQYDLAITANPNETGSTTVVSIGYTDSGDNDITDSLGNITSSSAPLPVTDWAAPVIRYFSYQDFDFDGQIDRFTVGYSEPVVAASTLSADNLNLFDSGDFIGAGFGNDATDLITGTVTSTIVNLGTEATVVDTNNAGTIRIYTQGGGIPFSLQDAAGNTNTAGVEQTQATYNDWAAPVIVSTSPADGATGVATTADVIVNFSEPMDTPFVTKTLNPPGGWSVVWSNSDQTATYSHTNYLNGTLYTDQINGGQDPTANTISASLVPNPWSFTTVASGGGSGGVVPSCGLLINADIASTNSLNVNLGLSTGDPDVDQMMISNASDFSGASWEAYNTAKAWTLAGPANGLKFVYAKVKTTADLESLVCSDTIIYAAPIPLVTGGGGGGGGAGPAQPVIPGGYEGLILQDPQPAGPLPSGVQTGTLVKRQDLASVYFIDQDNRRHPFPDMNTFNSWFKDFSGVQVISAETLSAIPLGSNVLMRPGTFLLKIQSLPNVYAVEPYGVIKWIESEEIARALYGDNWAKKIVDIDPVFFMNYQVGPSIASPIHPTGSVIQYAGESAIYYIENGGKRWISGEVFNSNSLQNRFVLNNITASLGYSTGVDWPALSLETLMTLR